MKWSKKKINIACRDGARRITAHVYGALAVHKRSRSGRDYVITHIPSGLNMCGYRGMDCLDGAKACVEHLSTLSIDWTKTNDALRADHLPVLRTVPREIDRFRDYKLRQTFRL